MHLDFTLPKKFPCMHTHIQIFPHEKAKERGHLIPACRSHQVLRVEIKLKSACGALDSGCTLSVPQSPSPPPLIVVLSCQYSTKHSTLQVLFFLNKYSSNLVVTDFFFFRNCQQFSGKLFRCSTKLMHRHYKKLWTFLGCVHCSSRKAKGMLLTRRRLIPVVQGINLLHLYFFYNFTSYFL